MIFADDTQLYHHFFPSDFHLALNRVTRHAQAVADWARLNGLTLNSAKTKVLIICSEAYTRELDLATISRVVIDGCVLRYVTEARSLGVTFTDTRLASACKNYRETRLPVVRLRRPCL